MSYSEQDGQVVLTMSRDDYNYLLFALGAATAARYADPDWLNQMLELMNRLNQGNPNYTPYQVGEKS